MTPDKLTPAEEQALKYMAVRDKFGRLNTGYENGGISGSDAWKSMREFMAMIA